MEQGPPDAIFGLVEAFKKDPRSDKVSLAIGAYRDGNNKPFVQPTVKKVHSQYCIRTRVLGISIVLRTTFCTVTDFEHT